MCAAWLILLHVPTRAATRIRAVPGCSSARFHLLSTRFRGRRLVSSRLLRHYTLCPTYAYNTRCCEQHPWYSLVRVVHTRERGGRNGVSQVTVHSCRASHISRRVAVTDHSKSTRRSPTSEIVVHPRDRRRARDAKSPRVGRLGGFGPLASALSRFETWLLLVDDEHRAMSTHNLSAGLVLQGFQRISYFHASMLHENDFHLLSPGSHRLRHTSELRR